MINIIIKNFWLCTGQQNISSGTREAKSILFVPKKVISVEASDWVIYTKLDNKNVKKQCSNFIYKKVHATKNDMSFSINTSEKEINMNYQFHLPFAASIHLNSVSTITFPLNLSILLGKNIIYIYIFFKHLILHGDICFPRG